MLVREYLGVKYLMTTTHHPQTNIQVKQFNHAIVTRLRQYVAKHHRNWDLYKQAL